MSGLEQLARKRAERALEVGHRDVFADDEAFDLLEHRRVRQVEIVAAIHLARHDDPHRRLVGFHVADLHRRGVRAQQRGRTSFALHCARQIERVLHVARRVFGRHVERFEVVIVVFDFGSLEHLVPETREDRFDLARGRSSTDGGGRAAGVRPGREMSTAPTGALVASSAVLRSASCCSISCFSSLASLPSDGLEVGRSGGHRLHQRGDGAALSSEVFVAEELEIRLRRHARRAPPGTRRAVGQCRSRRHTVKPRLADCARDFLAGRDRRWRPGPAWRARRTTAGSLTAMSASIFRSSVTPAAFRPLMSWP